MPPTTEVRFLSLEQVDALIAHLPQSPFIEIDRVLFLVAALTGLRKAPHGILCEVMVQVWGVKHLSDRAALVTTSWEYGSPEADPRLVSAYIEA